MKDALQVIEEYHARAVATGNTWAERLALKTTLALTRREPGRSATPTEPDRVTEWVPRVGQEAQHQAWGGSATRVTVLELDGGFTRVQHAGGETRWVLTTDLNPVWP